MMAPPRGLAPPPTGNPGFAPARDAPLPPPLLKVVFGKNVKKWATNLTENKKTRMHSSRMRTIRLLTVSQDALPEGVPAREWCTCPGGVPVRGVYLPGRVYLPRYSLCEQND